MKSDHFVQHEFEGAINKPLSYRDEEKIAEKVGVSSGMMSQYLNHNDDRESPLYKGACILSGWIDVNPDDGQEALRVFNAFVNRATPSELVLDLHIERTRAYKERNDFHIAEASGKSTQDRINELTESMAADERLLKSLAAERKREIQREAFPGQSVSHSTRSVTARKVARGKG